MNIVRSLHARAALVRREDGKSFEGVSHQYDFGDFRGYAGHFDSYVVEQLRGHEDVAEVQLDQVLKTHASAPIVSKRKKKSAPALAKQVPAPIPLQMISTNTNGFLGGYYYDKSAGAGTYAYVLDSGINAGHSELCCKRVTLGYNAIKDAKFVDDDGHGTHMAGVIGGKKYGVAKKTNLIAVKVYKKRSLTSIMLDGLNWAVNDITSKKREAKAVINISIGGDFDKALNAAVDAAFAKGITIVVAAGNDKRDATKESPASAAGAIAVGAVTDARRRADFSNFGAPVAIFAPGVKIESAYVPGSKDTALLSGTSSAAPFVAGLVVYFKGMMSLPDAKSTKAKILDTAVKGKVGDPKGSANLLAYNGCGK
ncbi:subtilisin-like protein [Myriangium duriaei CBS 260.36]|uniref:Subtilisin-like protein n=1 Tax=Myriangium duriaei CBS 260.36 TaxID=1168546 RepID=A0A9P4J0P4_9PEZI|nr:subtilisin-like protein [Myriangium duriaei CBS 260.36]